MLKWLNWFRDRRALMADCEVHGKWAKRFLCSYHRWISANHKAMRFGTRSWPRAQLQNLFITSLHYISHRTSRLRHGFVLQLLRFSFWKSSFCSGRKFSKCKMWQHRQWQLKQLGSCSIEENQLHIHDDVTNVKWWFAPNCSQSHVRWKGRNITKVLWIHPLGNKVICTKLHDNPSNGCWDISV